MFFIYINMEDNTELGNFSISLTVKDIKASRDFYLNLGFEEVFGNIDEKWLILKNGTTKIGLFEGMFETNILTFNPKWDANGEEDQNLNDIREIYQQVKDNNLETISDINESESGPNNFMIKDPDGNVILFDQHVN